jgi:hypothetical protein
MRTLMTLTAFATLFAISAFADTFSGNLIDVSCLTKPQPTVAKCQPNSSSTTFGLVDNEGKVVKLDDDGNSKAAAAMKNRADRSADPDSAGKGNNAVMATIKGTLQDSVLKVESIEVR